VTSIQKINWCTLYTHFQIFKSIVQIRWFKIWVLDAHLVAWFSNSSECAP